MNTERMTEMERRKIQRQMFALEDEKEAVEARYRFLLEQAQVGIFRIDSETGYLIEANKETVQLFHCETLEELKEHLDPDNHESSRFFDPRQFQNMSDGDAVSFSMHANKKDGTAFWARVILQSLRESSCLEGIISDISDQVRMDIELRKAIISAENARKEAVEANKAKSDFLANISHEIRTPLNGIIGFTEIIMASIDSPEGHLYAGKILDESENLMTLINQLLDIAKIEAKQLQLNEEPFYLRNLLAETISFMRLRARNKGLKLNVDFDERLPSCIVGDSYRIRQILLNLLSNAVKFTNAGSVSLRAVRELKSERELIVRFEVEDTGIGIPESMHDAVFESFVQADSSISRQFGGTGLGISISRELAELMGGHLWFESQVDLGSTFFFTIKTEVAEDFNPDAARDKGSRLLEGKSLKGVKVLIVEDYPTNREIAQHHLESAGCHVDLASNGLLALELVRKQSYEIILMDVHMPDISGLEVTRKIRSIPEFKDIPIIGMTANVMPANRQECREAGMNDFIAKPLRKKGLLDTVEFWHTHHRGTREKILPEPPVFRNEQASDAPLNYQKFLEEMDGDERFAGEVIRGFLLELDHQIDLIHKAREDQEWSIIHREAHAIKGGALNLSAYSLAEWAFALERAALSEHTAMIPLLLRELDRSLDLFREFCRVTLGSD